MMMMMMMMTAMAMEEGCVRIGLGLKGYYWGSRSRGL
jgi:hypothetical protein